MVLIFNSTVQGELWNFRDKFHSCPCYYIYIYSALSSNYYGQVQIYGFVYLFLFLSEASLN